MTRRKARTLAAALHALAFATALAPSAAVAHVVAQRAGLRQLLQSSEVAVVVEFASPLRMWSAPDGSDRQEYFTVRTLETLAGTPPPPRFDVFPHGEGMPAWREGERAILFLERTSRRPEFASLAARFPYFTLQESGQEWSLDGPAAAPVRSAARAYTDILAAPSGRVTARLRALLLRNLRSGVGPLREDAIAELVRAAEIPGFFAGEKDVAPFSALLAREAGLPVTMRVALARLLDGHGGFAASGALRGLTAEPLTAEERVQLVRVLASTHDAFVSTWLAAGLGSPDATLRRESAYALAAPWHAAELAALTAALGDPDPTVARAALRAIGSLGSPSAAAVLEQVAVGENPALGRLARAELRRADPPPAP